MSKLNNDKVVSNNNQRITAVQKHITAAKPEIPVAGKLVKPAAFVAVFQKSLDAHAAVLAKRAEYKAAVAERRAADAERRLYDDALKSWVLQRFGADSHVTHEFGYAARKLGEPNTETKAQAVKLAKATRVARGTVGKKEKLKIKGSLEPHDHVTEPAPAHVTEPAPAHPAPAGPATPPINATNGVTNGIAHA